MRVISLRVGDCLQRLEELDDGSVDAFVTDPPYEIGFMAKGWDKTGIAFSPDLWALVFRKLKPGGVVKVFSATRTFHRLAAALEGAGFSGLSLEAWGYGCLLEGGEVLTRDGWRQGDRVEIGDEIAAWEHSTNEIVFQPVERITKSVFDGPINQIVVVRAGVMSMTPNHRVYCDFGDGWRVHEVGLLEGRETRPRIPMSGLHEGVGIGPVWAQLLAWVWTNGVFVQGGRKVEVTIQKDFARAVKAFTDCIAHLRPKTLTRQGKTTWTFDGKVAVDIARDLPQKRLTWDLVWKMTSTEKQDFLRAVMLGGNRDVAYKGSLPNKIYRQSDEDLDWVHTLIHLSGWCGIMRRKDTLCKVKLRSTALVRNYNSLCYQGMVWCVQVKSGAFLCRDDDQIFVSGNSGFPKSLNIAKALDKKAGIDTKDPNWKPTTPEAKQWEGYGTALRPSWEPFLVAVKQ